MRELLAMVAVENRKVLKQRFMTLQTRNILLMWSGNYVYDFRKN